MNLQDVFNFLKDFKAESREDMQIVFTKLDRLERDYKKENATIRKELHTFKGRAIGFITGLSVVLVVINIGVAIYTKG